MGKPPGPHAGCAGRCQRLPDRGGGGPLGPQRLQPSASAGWGDQLHAQQRRDVGRQSLKSGKSLGVLASINCVLTLLPMSVSPLSATTISSGGRKLRNAWIGGRLALTAAWRTSWPHQERAA